MMKQYVVWKYVQIRSSFLSGLGVYLDTIETCDYNSDGFEGPA